MSVVGVVVASMVASPLTPAWDFHPAVLNVASLISACLILIQPVRAKQMVAKAKSRYVIFVIMVFYFILSIREMTASFLVIQSIVDYL